MQVLSYVDASMVRWLMVLTQCYVSLSITRNSSASVTSCTAHLTLVCSTVAFCCPAGFWHCA